MDAGLSPAAPTPHRSRAARRAEAQRAESAATAALNVLGQKWVKRTGPRGLDEDRRRGGFERCGWTAAHGDEEGWPFLTSTRKRSM